MPLNPRTLVPSSAFTPKSIKGLSLWLDASDSSALYTTDAGPVTAVSDPRDITGCLCWYDAADASSITKDGSNLVSQWNDKSGNNRHATASGSLRPTSGGSQNGRTVMQFTGTQALTITGNFLQTDNVTMFAVAMKNADHYGGIISSAPTNPEDSPILCFYLTAIAWLNRRVLVQQAVGNSVYRIVSGQSVGTAQQGFFDGVRGTATTASVATNTTNTITKIGALRTSSTADLNGNIAEIVCYSGNLSTTDRARVEAYLAAKWGIAGVHAPATASSDPVGAWLDKSGNGRHAVQAQAAGRPTISATAQNGRKALAFDGSNGWMRTERTTYAARSVFTVFRRTGTSTTYSSPFAKQSTVAAGYGGSSYAVAYGNEGGWSIVGSGTGRMNYSSNGSPHKLSAAYMRGAAMPLADAQNYLTGIVAAPNTTDAELLYAEAATDTDGNQAWFLGTEPFATTRKYPANILEVLIYNRALTVTERQRLERYLAAKWGISLAPTVSNADAQDWINRVYANGGTVSSSTAAAVNTLCDSLDASGVRPLMYRMGIFAGTGLNAALVPLYRGPSLGGTQYGNTTDTNVGPFVSGDYAETGASGGLVGNGSSKYLNTGLATNALSDGNRHISCYENAKTSGAYQTSIGSEASGNTQSFLLGMFNTTSDYRFAFGSGFEGVYSGSYSGGAHWMGVNSPSGSGSLYKNGSVVSTGTAPAATPSSSAVYVFAQNRGGSATGYSNGRIGGYSIGLGMNAPQAAAYNTAMQAFQTALTRNV